MKHNKPHSFESNSTLIKSISAAQRFDSRENPTVQPSAGKHFTAHLPKLGTFRVIISSGASTGTKEAVELRDGDAHAYSGRGVQNAVSNVETIIAPSLIDNGLRVDTDQKRIDQHLNILDGTKNKERL
ncbi:hypothetical protein NUU61_006993 [Penicillium alfredii]|uniref:Enolase N-terminal domain-containing protein n=1 Tax=Penicillium alfredii TaxID=1506179 RepID=A0A9W9F1V0_9EURO|nr:uncharacterized protein NUU61_006993 [Penicillium alfredii]KAJ5092123.1 hypothetical protein NUU61_006993 [Penicillium alfredii]